jgi:hypothetical protein
MTETVSTSQMAETAHGTIDAVRRIMLLAGWSEVRTGRYEQDPLDQSAPVVETSYVYGETRVKVWSNRRSVVPVVVFSFFGRSYDSHLLDSLKTLIE